MKKTAWLVLAASIFYSVPARADEAALERRVAALEQELAVLKRQLEVRDEDAKKKAPETAVVTANAKDGFSIKAPDGDFKFRARGYVQVDARYFPDNRKDLGTTDTFLPRRVRPIFEGTVWRDYDFLIQPDFGSNTVVLQDAYAEYKYWPLAKLRAGKFKEPFGLERLQADVNTAFVEMSLPTQLTPNRDVGVMLSGDLREGLVTYQVGGFNGVADNAGTPDADLNNDKDVAARVFAHPFREFDFEPLRGLGGGFAVTSGHHEGSTIPTYRSAGQAAVFSYASGTTADGQQTRISPQFYYYYNQLGVMGEYVKSSQDVTRSLVSKRLHNDAWQVTASWVLTGEGASYKGVNPRHAFDPSQGTWGAFEVAGRYGELDIDEDAFDLGLANRNASVSKIREWIVGLNWYLNRNVKLVLDYARSDFDDGATGEDRKSENAILGRAQVQF